MKRITVRVAVFVSMLLGIAVVLYWVFGPANVTTVYIQPSEPMTPAHQKATTEPTDTARPMLGSDPTNTLFPEPTAASRPAFTADPTNVPFTRPATTPPSGGGKLFGPFDWPASLADEWPFTASRLGYYSVRDLPEIESASRHGISVLVAMTGGRGRYTDADGCFSLQMWKDEFDCRDLTVLLPYINDGTVVGLYATDEPHDWECGPTYTELNELCAYVHSKVPNLPCGFGGASPAWYEEGLGETSFSEVDYVLVQYSLRYAPVEEWIKYQFDHAGWFGGDVWLSMNIDAYSPTPEQIRDACIALCQSDARAITIWKWPLHFGEPGMREAMDDIAAVCAGQSLTPELTSVSPSGRRLATDFGFD